MSMPAQIGDNRPPSPIEFAGEVLATLSAFMNDNPVIQTEEAARASKLIIDRTKASLDDMEDARKLEVGPLNARVIAINAKYKGISQPLNSVLDELKYRLAAFIRTEQARREREAEAARLAALEAERVAREAEQREQEAIDNAAVGELTDTASAILAADAAFNTFAKADRAATRAERDMHVKIGGGFRRSLSLRNTETLVLDDQVVAIQAMGLTPKINDAILSSARDYRKLNGKLPEGVRATYDQTI